jgi:UPF0755 protein
MTDNGLDLITGGGRHRPPGSRRATPKKKNNWPRRFVALLVVLLLVFVGIKVVGKVQSMVSGPADYTGVGTGSVVVEIKPGSTGTVIANTLKKSGVVKSAEAFYQLSLNDPRAQAIQAGFYKLNKQMSAKAALDALSDKSNRVEGRVVIPEGSRVGEIVTAIAKGSDIKQADLIAALKKPGKLGLPAAANGNPEGYFFPATYAVEPGTTALGLLKSMVAKTLAVEKQLNISTRAQALGLDSENILTVASILEYEAKKDADYPKVARVLYNRLKAGMPLQLDSTVSYVSKRKGDVFTTPIERSSQDPYNTYQHTGLPPGPIGSPGEKTIEAALNPAKGTWLYFVAINLNTGETVFSNTLAEHNQATDKLKAFCKTSDSC